MALSDLQVFSEKVYTTYQEMLDFNINLFNEATKGGLVLVPGSMQGDFYTQSLWARIASLVRRRNAYGSGALTTQQLTMKAGTKVKVAAGTNPINIEQSMLSWIEKSMDEAVGVIGKQLAQDSLNDMLSTAIKVFVAGVGAQASNVYDGTAGNANLAGLLATARLYGDRAEDIGCWLMHSKNLFDIWGTALSNSANLFKFGSVQVVDDGFGRPIIMSDHSSLTYVSTGTKYYILGLTPGAVQIEQNNDFFSNIQTANGTENIQRTWQAEWTYNVGLKGFSWNTGAGGASPNDAALATSTNWTKVAAATKDLAGVLGKFA